MTDVLCYADSYLREFDASVLETAFSKSRSKKLRFIDKGLAVSSA